MPRTTIAVRRLREAGLPYIVVLTDPTTGGVTASYAMLGDVHIAEPGSLICFAGPRVIEQTIREQLPEGFQRAEYLLEHGMIDMVVHRHKMRDTLARVCRLMMANQDPTWRPAPREALLLEGPSSADQKDAAGGKASATVNGGKEPTPVAADGKQADADDDAAKATANGAANGAKSLKKPTETEAKAAKPNGPNGKAKSADKKADDTEDDSATATAAASKSRSSDVKKANRASK